MSTLETRLREAIEFRTADVAVGPDLAAGARRRSAARRRRRVGGVGGGVTAVLSVGLAWGLTSVVNDSPAPNEAPPASSQSPTTGGGLGAPAGWHVEQWRGVSIRVPNTWASGALSTWCERGPLLGSPVVERPGDPQTATCEPAVGYGVQFLGPRRTEDLESHAVRASRPSEAAIYPRDAWVGVTCAECDVAVRVVAPSPFVARYLLSSYAQPAEEPSG